MASELQWGPPGPGAWAGDRTHKLTSMTRPVQEIWAAGIEAGLRRTFARYGMPLETIRSGFVNGYEYAQPQPVGVPEKQRGSDRTPPAVVLKALTRVHPEFRRRTKQAQVAYDERVWRQDAEQWRRESLPARIETNRALQSVDLDALDDAELGAPLLACRDEARVGIETHFAMLSQVMPIGDLLVRAEGWGIDPDEVVPLLAGASSASADSRERVAGIAGRVAAAGIDPTPFAPTTLEEVRAVSDLAAKELDEYLGLYGYRLVGASDLDGRTLVEAPEVVLRSVITELNGSDRPSGSGDALVASIRERVPAAERNLFDDLLNEARAAYGIREEEVGVDVSWTFGIYRHILLAA